MKADILLKGGVVVDPASFINERKNIAIKDGNIIETHAGMQAERVIDANGYYIFPGLIDFHAHVYSPGAEFSVRADPSFMPQGVTTVVDAGSAGAVNYDNFLKTSVAFSQTRIYGLLNVSPLGMLTLRWHEEVNPKYYDAELIKTVCEQHKGQIVGLKCRQSKDVVAEFGMEPLKTAINIAEKVGLPVVVHVTDPPVAMDELAEMLRPGDVLCHCYNGTGNTILANDGKVLPGVKQAQSRGVILDAANGKFHFSFKVARQALAEGILPDIISSDLTVMTLYMDYVFGLPYVMSKYLSLGMDISDIVQRCTVAPAKWLGISEDLGTLANGAKADIAIFKLVERSTPFLDTFGEVFVGDKLLVPQMTMMNGKIVYRNMEFATS